MLPVRSVLTLHLLRPEISKYGFLTLKYCLLNNQTKKADVGRTILFCYVHIACLIRA